ncbi:MAG: membrane fusion protein (multidrug efflux system), partial [Reinekea sp.]
TIQPLQVAQIPSLISAQVDSVGYRVGDTVSKGQVVVTMDTESLEIQKEQQLSATYATETQLKLAESQLKRTSELAGQGIATSSLLEEVQSNVEAMKANLNSQQAQIKSVDYSLRNAVIRAPLSGVVSARNVDPGQFIGVGSPLLEIVDLSVMELKVNVSTANNGLIRKGMPVEVSLEGLENQVFNGVISRISPVASVGTRTIPVYIVIENPDKKLRGGMFAIGQISLAEKPQALAIESTALQTDEDNRHFVFKVVDNKAVKQFVELGDIWGASRRQEITSGLQVGDQYVNVQLTGLEENDELQLIGN